MAENKDFETFDWDDEIEQESEYTILPNGDYDFEIVNFERATYDGSDKIPPCKMAIVSFRLSDGKNKGSALERFYLCKAMEWKLSELFKGAGLKKTGEKVKMQWDKLVGAKGRCKVTISEYNGKEYNRISKIYAEGGEKKEGGDDWD